MQMIDVSSPNATMYALYNAINMFYTYGPQILGKMQYNLNKIKTIEIQMEDSWLYDSLIHNNQKKSSEILGQEIRAKKQGNQNEKLPKNNDDSITLPSVLISTVSGAAVR